MARRPERARRADRRGARAARAVRPRRAARAVRGADERAEGAARRRQQVDRHRRHLPLRPPAASARPGIRVGGRAATAAAIQVADARRYRAYRNDSPSTCGRWRSRCASCARSRARAREEELDLEETIDATAKNAGELEIVIRPPRAQPVSRPDDGRRRLDGPLRAPGRAGCSPRRSNGALQGAAELLLPQLRLRARLRGRAFTNPVPVRDLLADCGPTTS